MGIGVLQETGVPRALSHQQLPTPPTPGTTVPKGRPLWVSGAPARSGAPVSPFGRFYSISRRWGEVAFSFRTICKASMNCLTDARSKCRPSFIFKLKADPCPCCRISRFIGSSWGLSCPSSESPRTPKDWDCQKGQHSEGPLSPMSSC